MYPHAVQRIYIARNEKTLRRSFQLMAFMPLFTTFFLVLLGIMAISIFPGLENTESDRTILFMIGELTNEFPSFIVMGPVLIAAVIAATMSTIDSALLSISSMITNDLYRLKFPKATNKTLIRVGKVSSITIMTLVVIFTIQWQDETIWRLLEVKLEVLAQIAPALMLGIQIKKIGAYPIFIGALFGVCVAVYLALGVGPKPLGVHAGIWGLGANVLVVTIVSMLTSRMKLKRQAD